MKITSKGRELLHKVQPLFGPLDGRHTFGLKRSGAEPAGGALTKNSKGFLRAVRPF